MNLLNKKGEYRILIKSDIVVTKRELCDQDWKTQLAKGYPNIPKGEEVIFFRKYNNMYGTFCDVFWNGNIYSVRKEDLIY